MTLELLGFDNPHAQYPAPVIPICRLDGKLVVVYPGGNERIDHVSEDSIYTHLTPEQLEGFKTFDPLRDRLFADDETHVFSYSPDAEKSFFEERLSNPEFCRDFPVMRRILEEVVSELE